MIDRIAVWALSLKARASDESGQDLTEYALITGGVAIALIVAVGVFSGAVDTWFRALGDWFGTIAPGGGGS